MDSEPSEEGRGKRATLWAKFTAYTYRANAEGVKQSRNLHIEEKRSTSGHTEDVAYAIAAREI